MKSNKISFFIVFCFIYCFSTKSSESPHWWIFDEKITKEKGDEMTSRALDRAIQKSCYAHALENSCHNITGRSVADSNLGLTQEKLENPYDDTLNESITNRIRLYRRKLPSMKPGDSSTTLHNDNKKVFFHKPTLDEHRIILQTLLSRSDALENPEEIADLVHIVDSGLPQGIGGFYSVNTDKIFIQKKSLSNPHELLHNITHEYQHYRYYAGHLICALIANRPIRSELEELRAEKNAIETVNCAGCAKQITKARFTPLTRYLLEHGCSFIRFSILKPYHSEGYYSHDMYTDKECLAKMKQSCELCSTQQNNTSDRSNPFEFE